jgi:hypothetical protein
MVSDTRRWLVLIDVAGDSMLEVNIAADAKPLRPSLLAHKPMEVLDFIMAGLIDARRGDEIIVELRVPAKSPELYTAPTSDAAVSWLASRLVEAWQPARVKGSSGPQRVQASLPDAAGDDEEPESEAG